MSRLKIGITCGDLSGIGLEVVLKTFADQRMLDHCIPIIYASKGVVADYRRLLNLNDLQVEDITDLSRINPKKLNVFSVWNDAVELTLGTPSAASGRCARLSLQAASKDLKEGLIDAMVTAPIDKQNMQADDFKYPGHTEFLAAYFGAEDHAMIMLSDSLRITFMTGHVPLSKVSEGLTFEKLIKRIRFIDCIAPSDFGIVRPRIAVLGLNPHNGDGGVIGFEERDIILPAIKKAKDDGLMVFGPYSADGFFGSGTFRQFDVVLAMYHDQGLIPFKTMNFENGVNYTAGLSKVRTSPDHGTAYDIAGQGVASEASLRDAIFSAIDIFQHRAGHSEWSSDPLKQFDLRKMKKPNMGGKGDKRKQGPNRAPDTRPANTPAPPDSFVDQEIDEDLDSDLEELEA